MQCPAWKGREGPCGCLQAGVGVPRLLSSPQGLADGRFALHAAVGLRLPPHTRVTPPALVQPLTLQGPGQLVPSLSPATPRGEACLGCGLPAGVTWSDLLPAWLCALRRRLVGRDPRGSYAVRSWGQGGTWRRATSQTKCPVVAEVGVPVSLAQGVKPRVRRTGRPSSSWSFSTCAKTSPG